MTPKPDRDRAVEELLRARHLRHAEPERPIGAACPDASELAAWADGALSAREAERLEVHLASCARCEAVLASFAKAAPPPQPPFWRRWAVLVPLAAATAAAVWFMVWPARQIAVAPVATDARLEAPAPPTAPMPAPPAVRREVAPPAAATPAVKTSRPSPPVAAGQSALKPGDMTTDQMNRASAKVAQGRPALASPEPPPPAAPAPVFRAAMPAPPPPAAPPPAGAAARQAEARSGSVIAEAPLVDTKKVAAVIEFASPIAEASDSAAVVAGGGDARAAGGVAAAGALGGGGGRGGRAGGGGSAAGAAQAEVFKPSGPTRWRILASGGVERSSGDGATWSPVAVDPTVRITSGVAPSATTCWLVGRGGAVLVTKDAVHFVRMDIPEPLDLVSVTATAVAVTVTAADGSTFTTLDGGLTWKTPTA